MRNFEVLLLNSGYSPDGGQTHPKNKHANSKAKTFTVIFHLDSHHERNNISLYSYPLSSCSLWAPHCVCIEGLLTVCTAPTEELFTVCAEGVSANIMSVLDVKDFKSIICQIKLIGYIQSYSQAADVVSPGCCCY